MHPHLPPVFDHIHRTSTYACGHHPVWPYAPLPPGSAWTHATCRCGWAEIAESHRDARVLARHHRRYAADHPTYLPGTALRIGGRTHQADATGAHVSLAGARHGWALADGIGDSPLAAHAAGSAAATAAYVATDRGAVAGLLAAAGTLAAVHDGDTVMVVAAPLPPERGGGWDIAWVGDCRAYEYDPDTDVLTQLAVDHTEGQHLRDSLAEHYRDRSQDLEQLAARRDNVVTSSVATADESTIGHITTTGPRRRLLLTSDGVHTPVPHLPYPRVPDVQSPGRVREPADTRRAILRRHRQRRSHGHRSRPGPGHGRAGAMTTTTAPTSALIPATNGLLGAALGAAGRGWPVFPLAPRSKRPAIPDWQQRATCDPDRIRRWWRRHPRHNVGIACGPAGLLVLDLDAAHEPIPNPWARQGITHGRDVLALLAQQAGEPDPVDTFTVAAPRGGEHRYFARPPGSRLRSTVGARGRGLGWHIDTRGPGALITAPGSLAVVRGVPVPYAMTWDVPVAVLPAWLVTALTPPPVPPRPTVSPVLPATSKRVTAYVQAAVAAECRNVAAATEGHRRITVYAAAAALGELHSNGWISHTAIVHHLTEAARHHLGIADFGWHELTTTIRDGIAAGREHPRMLTDRAAPRHRPRLRKRPTSRT